MAGIKISDFRLLAENTTLENRLPVIGFGG
jgi:hypothetical protein